VSATQRSQFSIRHTVPSDAAGVTACVESAYEKWIAVIGKKPNPMLQNYNEVLNDLPPVAVPVSLQEVRGQG